MLLLSKIARMAKHPLSVSRCVDVQKIALAIIVNQAHDDFFRRALEATGTVAPYIRAPYVSRMRPPCRIALHADGLSAIRTGRSRQPAIAEQSRARPLAN